MYRVVQLSAQDQAALSIGHLVLNSINNAKELDNAQHELTKMREELEAIKDQLPPTTE